MRKPDVAPLLSKAIELVQRPQHAVGDFTVRMHRRRRISCIHDLGQAVRILQDVQRRLDTK